jgi:tyrosine-protein phosphatase YwqE
LIDLHRHILPALDDEARDLDDSVEMARHAFAHGISVVAATPHIRERSPNVVIDELEERVGQRTPSSSNGGFPSGS